jgi:Fe-S oxidoreductase
MLTCRVTLLEDTGWGLEQNQRVKIHLGTAEVLARVALLEGDRKKALAMAGRLLSVFAEYTAAGYDIVCSCPTCGFMFRNLLKRGAYYAREYQEAIGAPGDVILKPDKEKTADGTPRYLQYNKSIDGELYCCGMAGIMGFKQAFHESSRKLGQDLLDVMAKKAPDLIVTDGLSCRLQFEQFTPFRVRHPIELL